MSGTPKTRPNLWPWLIVPAAVIFAFGVNALQLALGIS